MRSHVLNFGKLDRGKVGRIIHQMAKRRPRTFRPPFGHPPVLVEAKRAAGRPREDSTCNLLGIDARVAMRTILNVLDKCASAGRLRSLRGKPAIIARTPPLLVAHVTNGMQRRKYGRIDPIIVMPAAAEGCQSTRQRRGSPVGAVRSGPSCYVLSRFLCWLVT